MSEQNKAVARRWNQMWNDGDVSSVHEFIGDDITFRVNQIPPASGIGELTDVVRALREGFPDGAFTVDEMIGEGDTVMARWTFRGTQQGEWMGQAPTGKHVEMTGTDTSHLRDGKIVEHITNWDAMGMMQQLGAIEA
jgi:steroid delta-isomerase-like uncharacterized protein